VAALVESVEQRERERCGRAEREVVVEQREASGGGGGAVEGFTVSEGVVVVRSHAREKGYREVFGWVRVDVGVCWCWYS
jgi:hypothetical protein